MHVADATAWSGTDVAAALAQWSPAMPLVLTDAAGADIVLTTGPNRPLAGATAHPSLSGSIITACRVDLAPQHAGKALTDLLAHELGHCLGYRSPTTGSVHEFGAPSIMAAGDLSENQSETVTPADLDAVRSLYR